MTDSPISYKKNVEIALANASAWMTPADVAATTLLIRLSGLIDDMLNMGETKDLAPLVSRVQSLMNDLRLTPVARDAKPIEPIKETKNGADFAQDYLRLVKASGGNDTAQGSKPRTNSCGTDGKPRRAPNGVAKAHPKPRPTSR